MGASPPWAWDLLIFGPISGRTGEIKLRQIDDAGGEILWRSHERVEAGIEGFDPLRTFTIEAPEGATGQSVSGGPSVEVNAPVSGAPAVRLTTVFTAGDKPGEYVTTFHIHGNRQQMFVNVTE